MRENFDFNNPIFNSLLSQEVNKEEQSQIYHLIKLDTEDPEIGVLNLVDSNIDIQFGGEVYTRFPLQFTGMSMSSDGSIDSAQLQVANVSKELMYFVESKNKGFRGCTVKVKTVYEKYLDLNYIFNQDGSVSTEVNPGADSSAFIEDDFVIDSFTAEEKVLAFNLNPKINLDIILPRRKLTSNSCCWKFKDPNTCGYTYNATGSISLDSNTLSVDDITGFNEGDFIQVGSFQSNISLITPDVEPAVSGIFTLATTSPETLSGTTVSHILCDKMLQACNNRKRTKFFGGFPGIKSQRYIYF